MFNSICLIPFKNLFNINWMVFVSIYNLCFKKKMEYIILAQKQLKDNILY